MKLKERAKKLKTDIPAVFLALKHSKTKKYNEYLQYNHTFHNELCA